MTDNQNTPFFYEDAQRLEILSALQDTYTTRNGLAVITGASGCGLTTLMQTAAERLRASNPELGDLNVAHIDVSQTTVAGMLCELLGAFGYELPEASHTELLSITRLISQHQAEAGLPPLIVCEHVDRATPKVLALINALAETKFRHGFAFRMFLAGSDQLRRIVKAEGMSCVGERLSYSASIRPLTNNEQRTFIREWLRNADSVADEDVIESIVRASAGSVQSLATTLGMAADQSGRDNRLTANLVAGAIDHVARQHLQRVSSLANDSSTVIRRASDKPDADAASTPHATDDASTPADSLGEIMVSHDGTLIQHYPIARRKVLIGRAPHNDIVLDSKWVSRHHAIVVCTPTGASLVDINSTNGMTINSREARQGRLAHNDVVVIGKFRLKYRNVNARRDNGDAPIALSETRVLRSIEVNDQNEDEDLTLVSSKFRKPADPQ
ncbi:MAG: FHA domain-containing protein [Pseudomonadota bacterium]